MIEQSIQIGPLVIHWYGLILGLGMVGGGAVAARFAHKFNIRDSKFEVMPEDVWDALVWGVVFGIVGARMYHVIDFWEFYSMNPVQIVAVWNGGLGIFGAILGGTVGLGLWVGKKYKKQKSRKARRLAELLDVAAFGLPVGQAIGRWGNLVNQELYGRPTDLPWGIPIAPEYRLEGTVDFTHFHPLFAYEGLLNLVLFGFLWLLVKREILDVGRGRYFAVYLFGYSLIRFWLEPLRIEIWRIGAIPVAQLVAVLLMVLSLGWLVTNPNKAR